MRLRQISFFLLLSIFISKLSLAQKISHVNFCTNLNWNQVKEMAKAENKYIFLDFFATWCGPCKRMDNNVYSNDTVATFINQHFISVKIQGDSTLNDNKYVKDWYGDAKVLIKHYAINAYPTFIFLSPSGEIVYKDLGYKNVPSFVEVAKASLNPNNFYLQLQEYQRGYRQGDLRGLASYAKYIGFTELAKEIGTEYIKIKGIDSLKNPEGILFVRNIIKDKFLCDSLATSFKINTLDYYESAQLCNKSVLEFILNFSNLITSKDLIFDVCYNFPERIDSIIGKGYSKWLVDHTVKKEELTNLLFLGKKIAYQYPPWDSIVNVIQIKYSKINSIQFVLDYKIEYYKKLKEWPKFCEFLISRIDQFGPYGLLPINAYNYNGHAWDIFLNSSKKEDLEKALSWSNKAIKGAQEDDALSTNIPNFSDTKANILYKLNRIKEAIELEKEVVSKDPTNNTFTENLNKMINGLPTW